MRILAALVLAVSIPWIAQAEDRQPGDREGSRTLAPIPSFQVNPNLQVNPSGLEKAPAPEAPKVHREKPKIIERAPIDAPMERRSPKSMRTPVFDGPNLGRSPLATPGANPIVPGIARTIPDLSVSVKAPNGSGTYYDFIVRNDGTGEAGPTLFEVSLGPPCSPRPHRMTKRRVLRRYNVKALAVTRSSATAFRVGFDLGGMGDLVGTGCELLGTVDVTQAVDESDETNNAARVATAYRTLPDLAIAWDHSQERWGTKFGVENAGDAPAPASTLKLGCLAGGGGSGNGPCDPDGPARHRDWTWPIPSLGPGQRHMVDFPLPAINPAHTTWNALADPDDAIVEHDENNNRATNLH